MGLASFSLRSAPKPSPDRLPNVGRAYATNRLPRAPKGTGDLLSALFVGRRIRGDAPAIALEGATGAVYDVIVRSMAAESEDLLLPDAQALLDEPVTWPRARHLELA